MQCGWSRCGCCSGIILGTFLSKKRGDTMDLPKRKSIRLKNYDYSKNGVYFITICVDSKYSLMGDIINSKQVLNEYGHIVNKCIDKIAILHDNIEIDAKIVMPNHVHFIMSIVGVAYHATRDIAELSLREKSKMTVPKMIQQFKSADIKKCNAIWREGNRLHNMQPLQWQRGYYENIIRDENILLRVLKYIHENPERWEKDMYFISEDRNKS